MKKIILALNILSAIPGIIFIPLAPFTFFIVNGEGQIPGMLHEHAFMMLLLGYPFVLLGGVVGSIFTFHRERPRSAIIISISPLICAALLVWVFVSGGVQLN